MQFFYSNWRLKVLLFSCSIACILQCRLTDIRYFLKLDYPSHCHFLKDISNTPLVAALATSHNKQLHNLVMWMNKYSTFLQLCASERPELKPKLKKHQEWLAVWMILSGEKMHEKGNKIKNIQNNHTPDYNICNKYKDRNIKNQTNIESKWDESTKKNS